MKKRKKVKALTNIQKLKKAFGGCEKCYGKGYSTQLDFYSGRGEWGDEVEIFGQMPYYRPCECDRGKQISKLVKTIRDEASADMISKVFKLIPGQLTRRDKAGRFWNMCRQETIDHLNAERKWLKGK